MILNFETGLNIKPARPNLPSRGAACAAHEKG